MWLKWCFHFSKDDITTTAHNNPTALAIKNCGPYIKCITKIDGTTIDDAEDLDLVISMYNLLEYSSNYSTTTGGVLFYSKEEGTNFNFKSFKYKSKLLENTEANGKLVKNGKLWRSRS